MMNLWCRQVFYVLTCNHGPTVNVLCVLCFIVLKNLVEVSGTTRGDNKVLFKVIQGFLSVYYVSHWERADFPRTVSVARTPRQVVMMLWGNNFELYTIYKRVKEAAPIHRIRAWKKSW